MFVRYANSERERTHKAIVELNNISRKNLLNIFTQYLKLRIKEPDWNVQRQREKNEWNKTFRHVVAWVSIRKARQPPLPKKR